MFIWLKKKRAVGCINPLSHTFLAYRVVCFVKRTALMEKIRIMKRYYDYYDNYAGCMDEKGTLFDRNGNLNGSMVDQGRLCDY